ncbi:MAG: MerR family transcriptional regulator [Actinomycetota bacterium]
MGEQLMSITEVSARTGLQSSALRYYERSGLIRSEARIGGRRHYAGSILTDLAVVALLQEGGFTIAEIKQMLVDRGDRETWRALARQKLTQIDDHLVKVHSARDLLASAIACECETLERCELVQQRRGDHRSSLQRITLGVAGHERDGEAIS